METPRTCVPPCGTRGSWRLLQFALASPLPLSPPPPPAARCIFSPQYLSSSRGSPVVRGEKVDEVQCSGLGLPFERLRRWSLLAPHKVSRAGVFLVRLPPSMPTLGKFCTILQYKRREQPRRAAQESHRRPSTNIDGEWGTHFRAE